LMIWDEGVNKVYTKNRTEHLDTYV
jgi:hypothetical protein